LKTKFAVKSKKKICAGALGKDILTYPTIQRLVNLKNF